MLVEFRLNDFAAWIVGTLVDYTRELVTIKHDCLKIIAPISNLNKVHKKPQEICLQDIVVYDNKLLQVMSVSQNTNIGVECIDKNSNYRVIIQDSKLTVLKVS